MSNTKKQRTSNYSEFLYKQLRDPKKSAAYLTAALDEGDEAFLLAVRDVAEARGGIGPLARATRLNREGLYAMLSASGNPRFSSLSDVLDALDMRMEFTPKLPRIKAA